MSKLEIYSKVFKTALNLEDSKFSKEIKYNEVEEWDSIGHMTLSSRRRI